MVQESLIMGLKVPIRSQIFNKLFLAYNIMGKNENTPNQINIMHIYIYITHSHILFSSRGQRHDTPCLVSRERKRIGLQTEHRKPIAELKTNETRY